MPWDVRNYWADIADIRIDDTVTNSRFQTQTEFRMELRTSSHEIDLDDVRFMIGFSKMTLHLECHGAEIAIGDRHGDHTPVNDIITKVASETKTSQQLAASAKASITPSSLATGNLGSVGVSSDISNGSTKTEKTSTVLTSKFVTAKPNDKWEIYSQDKTKALDAKYITHENPLCLINPKAKSNRTEINAHLYAHKNDMVISTPDENRSRFSVINPAKKNKEKLFAILIGKEIDARNQHQSSNSIVRLTTISSLDSEDA